MTPLHRTAILSCAAVVALVLGAALLLRGGRDGPFHRVETAVTPTVEVVGFPDPDAPAGAAERADLDRLAGTTLALVLMAAATALVSLLGVIGSENLSIEGRRAVEVMLGAPPLRLVGGAARVWSRRLLWASVTGGGLAAAGASVMAGLAPPGTSFAPPSATTGAGALVIFAAAVVLYAILPVRGLYRWGRPLRQEAESHQLTDPRPRRFNRVLLITLQLSAAVAIVAGSGLLLASRGGGPGVATGPEGRAAAGSLTVVALLSPVRGAAHDPAARAALFESALAAVRDAPELVAASLGTPGSWLGRGPEVLAANECGACSTGGMPHPVHLTYVKHHAVMPGFFAGRGLRFVAGRGFADGAPGVEGTHEVVINQAYARAHFLEPPVIGRWVALGGFSGEAHRVVGVVRDGGGRGLGASGSPYSAYFSALDHPPSGIEVVASVPVSAAADEDDSREIVRAVLEGIPGGGLAVAGPRPAREEVERVFGTAPWLGGGARAAGALGALAAVFAMVGAVRAHVRSRLRDMGIRGAIGATPRRLRRLILGEALRMGAVGVGVGLWGAALVVGVLAPPGVANFDGAVFAGVAAVFLVAAVGAALPGARQAATAEPRSIMDA
ncbi:MAG: hypothetical protein OXQ94_09105 [Gemmatimonadota bacterium]|nr:hypothetical protein [Gemmatimonadota bacterium]MDE2871828.1 hypothetical protein [Gemmatimonadota bacterium]